MDECTSNRNKRFFNRSSGRSTRARTVWVFGGLRNTVMARRGWRFRYLFDVASAVMRRGSRRV